MMQQNVSTVEMNNTELDFPKYLNAVMPMVDLIEYSDNFQKYLEVYITITDMNQMLL